MSDEQCVVADDCSIPDSPSSDRIKGEEDATCHVDIADEDVVKSSDIQSPVDIESTVRCCRLS